MFGFNKICPSCKMEISICSNKCKFCSSKNQDYTLLIFLFIALIAFTFLLVFQKDEYLKKCLTYIKRDNYEATKILAKQGYNKTANENIAECINWGPYMRKMEKNIKRNWPRPKGNRSKSTTILFEIKKSGKLAGYKVIKSSKDKRYDKIAIEAIKKTRYERLPKKFKPKSVFIEFRFDYNVYQDL